MAPRTKTPSISREVFEIHLDYMNKTMTAIKDELVKVNVKVEAMERTILRNTITVEEHHRRSNLLESNQEKFLNAMTDLTAKVSEIGRDFHRLEDEIVPLKAHTEKVNRAVAFFVFVDNNKMMIFKITVLFAVLIFAAVAGVEKLEWLKKLIF